MVAQPPHDRRATLKMGEPRSPTPPFSCVVVRRQAHRVLMQSQRSGGTVNGSATVCEAGLRRLDEAAQTAFANRSRGLMDFQKLIRSSPRRWASLPLAEGFSPTASGAYRIMYWNTISPTVLPSG